MGTLFRLLKNELLSLGLLFFVIVPFVNGAINDQRAPAGVQEFAYKAESIISNGIGGNMQIRLPDFSSSGKTALHTSHGPIFIPGS